MHVILSLSWILLLSACFQETLPIDHGPQAAEASEILMSEPELEAQAPLSPPPFAESFTMPKNSSTYTELKKLGFTAQEINKLSVSSKPVSPLNRIHAGTPFTVWWSSEAKLEKKKLEIGLSPTKVLRFALDAEDWKPELIDLPVEKSTKTFTGLVKTSLWNSAIDAGMEAHLIAELAEIFAWQIDFSREVRWGDRWRLVVNEKFVDGKSIGWGSIVAAQYSTSSGELFTGIKYPQNAENASYYQEDGSSLRRLFLKNPIKFGRITSRFTNRRFHPVLKKNRPHYGVDYAAPTGTPVRSVGDGKIVYIGRKGGSGKMIKVRHNSVYTTAYLHLSRYAKKLKRGSTVKQGETIGYVGQTGLATGPHLHFSFYKHGRYADPLSVKFPSADPVAQGEMGAFALVAKKLMQTLPEWETTETIAEQELGIIESSAKSM